MTRTTETIPDPPARLLNSEDIAALLYWRLVGHEDVMDLRDDPALSEITVQLSNGVSYLISVDEV
jgi:hypothetical protein